MLYDAAPVTAPHPRFSDVGWFTDPLDGEASVGTAGVAMIVVKLHAPDHDTRPADVRRIHFPVVRRAVRKAAHRRRKTRNARLTRYRRPETR